VQPPSIEEILHLVAIAIDMPGGLDFRDVVSLIWNAGLTPGELLGIRWSDVNFDDRIITVSSITGKHIRRIPFGEKVWLMLRARLERANSSDAILGAAPNVVLGRVSRRLRALSADSCDNIVTLIGLRRAFVQRVLDSVCDASFTAPAVDCRYVPLRCSTQWRHTGHRRFLNSS
jgi:integrase